MDINLRSPVGDTDPLVRRDEAGDHDRVIIDFGPGAHDVSADVVDGTVIMVGPNEEQYEIDVSTNQARTFMKNGVLTIETSE